MPCSVVIGNLRPEVRAAQDLALPLVGGFAVGAAIADAIQLAAVQRRGVAVLAPKGAGKSVETAVALSEWDEAEAAKEAADATYRVRRVRVVRPPRDPVRTGRRGALAAVAKAPSRPMSYREVVLAILGVLVGAEPDERGPGGRRKKDQVLLADAVEAARAQDVAVLVIEETERLGPDGFTALRDFMADAEASDPDRIVVGPQAGLRAGERAIRAGGVGLVLLGTPAVRVALEGTDEAGERWADVETVPGLSAAQVPELLVHFFPAFAADRRAADARAGRGAWGAAVTAALAGGRPVVSLRHVENVARNYYRLLVGNTPPEAAAPTRETARYDAELFAYAAERAAWHRPGAEDGSAPRPALDRAFDAGYGAPAYGSPAYGDGAADAA